MNDWKHSPVVLKIGISFLPHRNVAKNLTSIGGRQFLIVIIVGLKLIKKPLYRVFKSLETTASSEKESQSEPNKDLKAILYLLQSNLEKMVSEVDRGYALYNIGEVTPLVREIQGMMNDPLSTVLQASETVDGQVKQILNTIVTNYLKNNTGIASAYRSKNVSNHLHYSIILKEDTSEQRTNTMDFFEWYLSLGIDDRYPVIFQFVPEKLITKINTAEKVA